uniref:Uncharacterized protein n=1 Tax=Syphacia muris TaxID=451379 RepID=A0A0N5AIX8_9BILA
MAEETDISPETTPDFPQIQPSLACFLYIAENISDLLSIIGADANVIRVIKDLSIQKNELYGFIGFGPVDGVFSCDTLVKSTSFLPLNLKKNGEIATALLNITFPKAFIDGEDKDATLKSDKINEAAFAQNFISRIEVQRKAYSHMKLSECFGIVLQDNKVYLLHANKCWDETTFFKQYIWEKDDKNQFKASLGIILKNHAFRESSGMLLAVVHDEKLQLKKKLTDLQNAYSRNYGNYDNDRTMSKEDWADVSALNATISEAESFELVIEGPRGRRSGVFVTDVSASEPDENQSDSGSYKEERYNAFCRIKDAEKKLWAEQEKFKYSMIPGRDVVEARKEFFDNLKLSRNSKRTLLRTLLTSNTSHNLMHRQCLSTGHDRQKFKRKIALSDADNLGTPRRLKRLNF